MRALLLVVLVTLACLGTKAQSTVYITDYVTHIALPEGSGTNAAGVAYHPDFKYLYFAMAGNADYPLYVYDGEGQYVDDVTGGIDFRGIWYNPDTKQLEANAYNDDEVYTITLNDKGIPTGVKGTGVKCADAKIDNAAWAYVPGSKLIMAYNPDADRIVLCDRKTGVRKKSVPLAKVNDGATVNSTTIMYTDIQGKELALVNVTDNALWLYDAKTGKHTETIMLPDLDSDFLILPERFNMAWTEDIIWVFDTEFRTWYAFQYGVPAK
jgi:hypothetical protein